MQVEDTTLERWLPERLHIFDVIFISNIRIKFKIEEKYTVFSSPSLGRKAGSISMKTMLRTDRFKGLVHLALLTSAIDDSSELLRTFTSSEIL